MMTKHPHSPFPILGALVWFISLSPLCGLGQTNTINYIMTETPAVEFSSVTALGANNADVSRSIQYIDGLGRTIQTVEKQQSRSGRDLVSQVEYDEFGNVVKIYAPYTYASATGNYDPLAVAHNSTFYQTANRVKPTNYGYSETTYQMAPGFRVEEQSAPGESWAMGGGHTVTSSLQVNSNELVYIFTGNATTCTASGNYSSGLLLKSVTTDEHGNDTEVFTDKLGRNLKSSSVVYDGTTTTRYETYFVYDELGRVSWVIPPEASNEFNASYDPNNPSTFPDVDSLSGDLCFHYTYDYRSRVIEKKVPGANPELFVYNKLDQLVLHQTGMMSANDQWYYYKYDRLGRPVEEGIHTTTVSHTALISAVSAWVDLGEDRTSTNYATQYGYTNTDHPTSNKEVLKVYYYDDYDFNYDGTPDVFYTTPSSSYTQDDTKRTKSLPTSIKVKVLNSSSTFLSTHMFYDELGRQIQVRKDLYPSGQVIHDYLYNHPGSVTNQKITHTYSSTTRTLEYRHKYDTQQRLIKIWLNINAGGEKLIAHNFYNELGQLVEKNLGRNNTALLPYYNQDKGYLQSMDYAYNERGWLEYINNCDLKNNSNGFGVGIEGYESHEVLDLVKVKIIHVPVGGVNTLEMVITDSKYHVPDMALYDPNQTYTLISTSTTTLPLMKETDDQVAYADLFSIAEIEMTLDFHPIHNDSITDSIIIAFGRSLLGTQLAGNGITATESATWAEGPVVQYLGTQIYDRMVNDDGNDIWGTCIDYDASNTNLGSTAQYNGNISAIKWKSKNDNQQKAYAYYYDGLNRLTDGFYKEWDGGWTQNVNRYTVRDIGYDFNGNITTLTRLGLTNYASGTFGVMDNLTFAYDGNRLKAVEDASSNPVGVNYNDFVDGVSTTTEYTYDDSGNMKADGNKDIDIFYNYLNLPELIQFPGVVSSNNGQSIENIYTADGVKVAKHIHNDIEPGYSTTTTSSFYQDGFQFNESGVLDHILISEGRITYNTSASAYEKEYHVSDHLGNLRAVFADANGNGSIQIATELVQELNYYPFGLEHKYASGNEPPGAEFRYRFNGKESYDELSLYWLDYGARYYDAQLGRWCAVDPMAQLRTWVAPYNFVQNNPIMRIDPTGALDDDYYYNSKGEETKVVKKDSPDRHFISDDNGNTAQLTEQGLRVVKSGDFEGFEATWQTDKGGFEARVRDAVDGYDGKEAPGDFIERESRYGGDLDQKLNLNPNKVYGFGGLAMNRNEAGNAVWGGALKVFGMGQTETFGLAHVGTMILAGRLDEADEVKAAMMGNNYIGSQKPMLQNIRSSILFEPFVPKFNLGPKN